MGKLMIVGALALVAGLLAGCSSDAGAPPAGECVKASFGDFADGAVSCDPAAHIGCGFDAGGQVTDGQHALIVCTCGYGNKYYCAAAEEPPATDDAAAGASAVNQ